jgi:hypothetical protein
MPSSTWLTTWALWSKFKVQSCVWLRWNATRYVGLMYRSHLDLVLYISILLDLASSYLVYNEIILKSLT